MHIIKRLLRSHLIKVVSIVLQNYCCILLSDVFAIQYHEYHHELDAVQHSMLLKQVYPQKK